MTSAVSHDGYQETPGKDASTAARRSDVVLETTGLRKRFGGVMAVDSVSVTVRREEVTGMIGPNGSGKTTTFNMIAGSVRPDGGKVYLEGRDVTASRPYDVVHHGLVRTFQLTRVFRGMTVAENLAVGGKRHRLRRALMWDLVDVVGLEGKVRDYAGDLSFGQQKLLELVRAAVLEPTIMLLDEPFAGVNPTMARRLVDFIQYGRRERGMSFFVIDHEMRLIMEICDYIYVMNEGKLICEGRPDHVQDDPATMEAYFGKGYIGGSRAP